MKVTPSNQTLILAGEQAARGGTPGAAGASVLNAASSGAVLRRVTMVTAWPDSTVVYVRADYAPTVDVSPGRMVATQPKSIASGAQSQGISGASKDVYGNPQSPGGHAGLSSYLRPEEQYAQTQRLRADAPRTSHLDVTA